MKKIKSIIICIILLILAININAKTICSMTFNSSDEKNIISKNLKSYGYDLVELVPANKDPNWFSKSCQTTKRCDILIISGHFGGLFFGENSSQTLSLNQLISAREKMNCPGILDRPQSVFLMGCNTLSSKTPDHRSVNDYLRILVGDGFPLNLAEDVAASRYLNFGQSMSEFMNSIFNNSKLLIGFESTGPLGATAAPLLNEALRNSSESDKIQVGISEKSLLSAFRGTNLRVLHPENIKLDKIKTDALSSNTNIAQSAWESILSSTSISTYYDFIVNNQKNQNLNAVISNNPDIRSLVFDSMMNVFNQAEGLSGIQYKVSSFLVATNLINHYEYQDMSIRIISKILLNQIDYISAEQLCSIFKDNQKIQLDQILPSNLTQLIQHSSYRQYLNGCAGKMDQLKSNSKAYSCLVNHDTYDWGCLTNNLDQLDLASCKLAKSRNNDPENADDMLWFCYSKLLEQHKLSKALCAEVTESFSILGNQIKMNWNCLNRI